MQQRKVLVVDDDKSVRHSLSILLTAASWDVELASSGKQALSQLQHKHFDVVLSDVRMPEMIGSFHLRTTVALLERELITSTIRKCGGRMDESADLLGIGRRTLTAAAFAPHAHMAFVSVTGRMIDLPARLYRLYPTGNAIHCLSRSFLYFASWNTCSYGDAKRY